MPSNDLELSLDIDLDLNLDLNQPAPEDLMADYEYTGDVEVDSKAEMSAVLAGFVARHKAEAARREKATDSEYWFCVCFQSRSQVEEFLQKSGWAPATEKYLDGQKLARKLGVDIAPDTLPFRAARQPDDKLAKMAMRYEK